MVTKDANAEVRDHERESLPQGHGGLPSQKILCPGDVRLSLVWVILCVGPELDTSIWVNGFLDHLDDHKDRLVTMKTWQWGITDDVWIQNRCSSDSHGLRGDMDFTYRIEVLI